MNLSLEMIIFIISVLSELGYWLFKVIQVRRIKEKENEWIKDMDHKCENISNCKSESTQNGGFTNCNIIHSFKIAE